jgi:hypothetical protein
MNNFKINAFPPEVIKELNYYVYRLIDPRNGETFYVGKGKGNRVFEHLKTAIKKDDEVDFEEDDLKYQRIREIKNSGLEVIHIIHRHKLDEATALHIEAALIDIFPNATNKQVGHLNNEIGSMNAYEVVRKYQAEVADFSKHKLLLISINNTVNNKETYDAVRFAWRIDPEEAKKADYVLALNKGIIIGVFEVESWKKATVKNFPEFGKNVIKRWGFIGKEAEKEIQDLYLHKRIPTDLILKQNPIRYSWKKS